MSREITQPRLQCEAIQRVAHSQKIEAMQACRDLIERSIPAQIKCRVRDKVGATSRGSVRKGLPPY